MIFDFVAGLKYANGGPAAGGKLDDFPYRMFDGNGVELTAAVFNNIQLVNTITGECVSTVYSDGMPHLNKTGTVMVFAKFTLAPPLRVVGKKELDSEEGDEPA